MQGKKNIKDYLRYRMKFCYDKFISTPVLTNFVPYVK